MYVFLDTACIPASDEEAPTLLSVGLCTFGGAEFYAEVLTPVERAMSDPFLRDCVLPQLGHGLGVRGAAATVAAAVVDWLDGLGNPTLDVCHDAPIDYRLFAQLLALAPRTPSAKLRTVPVAHLLDDQDGAQAADSRWSEIEADRGLKRHHALADAWALMARFEQVHGR